MERRHVHPSGENGRYARIYGLLQIQRAFSPQAAPTTTNQRALLSKLQGFKWATAIDLSIGYMDDILITSKGTIIVII